MMHKNRVFRVNEITGGQPDLVEKLTEHSWTSCTAWRLTDSGKTLTFYNDQTSADGAGEWAVYENGQQIESITFSWCTPEKSAKYVRELFAGELGMPMIGSPPREDHPKGACHHCA
jgi:hypothetical protein